MPRALDTTAPDVPVRILLGSFSIGVADELHDLVRAAHEGKPEAVSTVLERVRRAARLVWPHIPEALVVPVPGHMPGPVHPLLRAISAEIATVRGWDQADVLRRRRPGPEAKAGGDRDPEAEATTLEVRRPTSPAAIVLVDDVVRTGASLRACVGAIRAGGDGRVVVAVVLAAARGVGPGG
jgi:hypothetical protein